MKFFSPYMLVQCPDGPRYILKNPEKAFAIAAPDWDVRVKAVVKFLETAQADIDVGVKKELKSVVKDLSESYAALQAHYQAAYLAYATNPCSKEAEKAYQQANAVIRKKEFAIRQLEVKTETLSDQMKTAKISIKPSSMIRMRRIQQGKTPRRIRRIKRIEKETEMPIMFPVTRTTISATVNDLKKTVSKLKK